MNLINILDKIVEEKGLKIWDKRVIPELKNEIIITNFCRSLLGIYNYGNDSFENITITLDEKQHINRDEINLPIEINLNSKYIILGESNILYYTEYLIGSNYQIIKGQKDIVFFLNELLSDIDDTIYDININLEKWKICWHKLYDMFTDYSKKQDIETRFKLELFNLRLNNNYTNKERLSCIIKNLYKDTDYYKVCVSTDPVFFNISYNNDLNKTVDYFIHDSRDREYNKYENSPSYLLHILDNEIENYRIVEGLCFY